MCDNTEEVILARTHAIAIVVIEDVSRAAETRIAIDTAASPEQPEGLSLGRRHPVMTRRRIDRGKGGDRRPIGPVLSISRQGLGQLCVAGGTQKRLALAQGTRTQSRAAGLAI